MFNKVILVGNLTRDIELRYSSNGTAYARTAIAVTRKFSSNGKNVEETCFIDISLFGKTAEVANQYLSKGSKILVEGRLKFDQWQDNNGQNRSKHSVSVDSMEMLGNRPSNNMSSSNYQNNPQTNYQGNTQSNYDDSMSKEYQIPEVDIDELDKYDEEDETIPF